MFCNEKRKGVFIIQVPLRLLISFYWPHLLLCYLSSNNSSCLCQRILTLTLSLRLQWSQTTNKRLHSWIRRRDTHEKRFGFPGRSGRGSSLTKQTHATREEIVYAPFLFIKTSSVNKSQDGERQRTHDAPAFLYTVLCTVSILFPTKRYIHDRWRYSLERCVIIIVRSLTVTTRSTTSSCVFKKDHQKQEEEERRSSSQRLQQYFSSSWQYP